MYVTHTFEASLGDGDLTVVWQVAVVQSALVANQSESGTCSVLAEQGAADHSPLAN